MRDRLWSGLLLSALATLWPSVAAAQDRPFAFATSPAAWERDGALVFIEPAWADAAPEAMARDGFASRMGFEARVARRVLLVGDVGFAESAEGSPVDFRAEALFDLRQGVGPGFHLAAGTGYRHEATGASVWLGRLVGERVLPSYRLLGDLRLEKALETEEGEDRDELDAILTLAAARRLGKGFSLGAEVVGEDLEAFWQSNEAEGGARVLAGPSLHWVRSDHHLLATLAGGPVFRYHASTQSSTAPRSLGNGYAVRASLGAVF